MTSADDKKNAASWDAYWRGPDERGQAIADAGKGSAIDAFWRDFFERALAGRARCEIADIACGAGAVTAAAGAAAKKLNAPGVGFYCLDLSSSGALAASTRAQRAFAVAADAAAAPFRDQAFDIAASLFGAEYAGVHAFGEMARLVRPRGVLMAVAHRAGGPLAKECADNLTLIEVIVSNGLIDKAQAAFDAGFALDRGEGDSKNLAAAERDLNAAAALLTEALKSGPQAPVLAFLQQVHTDLGVMMGRRRAYDPGDVSQWLANIGGEASAYKARMEAMLGAALTAEDVAAIQQMIEAAGLVTEPPGDMHLGGHKAPAAWIISAARAAD